MPEEGTTALVFPGQGSQSAGMGRDLYETYSSARAVFELADRVTGFPLTKLIFEGPEEELRLTINAQPAIVTVSLAALRAMEQAAGDLKLPKPAFTAGHSLGEYAALAVSGVIDFETAIYLVRQRGRLMHEAGQLAAGGMAAVLGLEEAPLNAVCAETNVIIANYNSPRQLVISGAKDNVAKAMELAKQKGAARVVPLQVSGAFHSPLMKPAQDELAKIISGLKFNNPAYPVIGNVTALPLTNADDIKTELIKQLCSGVQWQKSVEYMAAHGVSTFIEVGPGKVLAGLIKRIRKEAAVLNVSDVPSVKTITHSN
jgi:[acyl-carrier-protein] S-malonyltransferase